MNMKKLFAFILAAAMALMLFACGKAAEPTASSSGLGGPKLYILADRGEGQMYYKVLELHPDSEFDGADEPMDEKYIEYLIRCQVYEDEYRDWTNGQAEERLRGNAHLLEREYTAANLAKFNELGLTTGKLHTLLDMKFNFTIEDIMEMDTVPHYLGEGPSDVIIYNKLYAVVPSAKSQKLAVDEVNLFGLTDKTTQEELVQKLGEPKETIKEGDEEGYEKSILVYDGMRFTFIEKLYGEPFSSPELYLAEFTRDDLTYPRGIKLGDSLYDVVANFPQERDYRSEVMYGDPMDKYAGPFAKLLNYNVLTQEEGNYELLISCGWWPTVCINFDGDLKTESIYIYYHSNGLGYP